VRKRKKRNKRKKGLLNAHNTLNAQCVEGIMSYLEIALKAIEDLKTEPSAQQESLQASINAIAEKTVAEVIKIGRWKSSNETIRLENEAESIQRKVINGQCQIIDYKEAVRKWKAAGIA
jgi:hypothetical protein